MARYKTFVNGGSLLPGDLDAMEDDYECAFGTYKDVWRATGTGMYVASTVTGAGVYLPIPLGLELYSATPNPAGWFASISLLNPAHYWTDASTEAVNPRQVWYNLRFSVATNGTASGLTFTGGLYPVTAIAGSSGALNLTLGSVVTGSAAAVASPAASTLGSEVSSGDFVAPAVGWYALAANISGALPSNSDVILAWALQVRQI